MDKEQRRRKEAFAGLCDMVMHEMDVKGCMMEGDFFLETVEEVLKEYRSLSMRTEFKKGE